MAYLMGGIGPCPPLANNISVGHRKKYFGKFRSGVYRSFRSLINLFLIIQFFRENSMQYASSQLIITKT